ncbi:hypothetical protein NEOLEDRAFT_1162207 [Neolentinus lepideus HHB14362 ss-1]|uniref:Monopolin complex subunit Csm1/Pcs1 C-terminal domain-containing protein n=1 Tax=Neolentinus lepideus HHB14362 ss-1 TaxID=1314782 RepID=A0A165TFB3_9AGAM|nr:hypothetical protein NEOLEDRAFT_1162207 [Neolentinus lepideus HHB14362 ss-1]
MVDDAATEAPNKRPKTSDPDRAVQQLNKLQKELDSAIAERDALRQQLEEVHSVRYTEAEELVEQQKANHELQLKTCEQYIEELETRLARVDSHAQSGHTSSLRFITREAADEEKRSLEQEVSKWKDMAKRADQDKLDVLQSKKELEIELKAEIERSKTLAAGVPSAPKGRSNGAQHEFTPAQSQVLRFYEDLTNLLVTKHTREPSAVQGLPEESCYTCIYTHAETYIAINFTLRLYVEASEDSDELIEKVKYIPHDLDKESPAFREKLDYLKDPFIFERSQLHVFLWSLGETLKEKEQDEQENNADDNSGELVYPE